MNSVPSCPALPEHGQPRSPALDDLSSGKTTLTLATLNLDPTPGHNLELAQAIGCLFAPPLSDPEPGASRDSVCFINTVARTPNGTAECFIGPPASRSLPAPTS